MSSHKNKKIDKKFSADFDKKLTLDSGRKSHGKTKIEFKINNSSNCFCDKDRSCDENKCLDRKGCSVPRNISVPPGLFSVNYHNPTSDNYWIQSTFSPLSVFGPNGNSITPNHLITWCGQVSVVINITTLYNTIPISSYDPCLLSVLLYYGVDIIQYNIRKVNYILNRLALYTLLPNYTFGDVQTAIWQLLDYPGATDGAVPYNQNNVTFILNDANANGANYIPCKPDDYNCIFMISISLNTTAGGPPLFTPPVSGPPSSSSNFAQVMLLPIQLKNLTDSPFYVDCGDDKCNC
jgi:hypothetical protein